jgi:hypothetical protein
MSEARDIRGFKFLSGVAGLDQGIGRLSDLGVRCTNTAAPGASIVITMSYVNLYLLK